MKSIETTLKIIKASKWLSFFFGAVMCYFTIDSFGGYAAIVLGIIATSSLWIMMKREETRLIGEFIARDIKDAIYDAGDIENVVEIKRLKKGLIARVYLINAREKSVLFHKAIAKKLEDCKYKKYLWVMQLTDMPKIEDLRETQKRLNSQLLDEIIKNRGGNKK